MSDPLREQIMARYLVVTQGISFFNRVERNAEGFPAQIRPAGVLRDGNEEHPQTDVPPHHGTAKTVVVARPTFDIMLGDTKENIGTSINKVVALLQTAVLADAQLKDLCQRVSYVGMESRLSHSFDADCDMRVHFAFHYLLNPRAP